VEKLVGLLQGAKQKLATLCPVLHGLCNHAAAIRLTLDFPIDGSMCLHRAFSTQATKVFLAKTSTA
jgi:hypothetical protein